MTTTLEKTFSVGKFLVSPFAKLTEAGDFIASLSIRSGCGSAQHDRVFRFLPRFATHQDACDYATHESHRLLQQQCAA